jgi:thiol-disulfide isomerase/thioredoxin
MSNTPPPTQELSRPASRRALQRALPTLVLAALLLATLVAGVLKVQSQVDDSSTGTLSIADQEAIQADVNHRAVTIEGSLLADGTPWSSTSARGSLLVVNYWASWCGPCRAEQPSLTTVARRYASRGVKFIGINIRDNQAAARAHVQEFKIPYPSLFDPGALTATKLEVFALPSTFILDRDGVVAYRLTGRTNAPLLADRLDTLLARGGRWRG